MSYQHNRVRSITKRTRIFSQDRWSCAYCLVDLSMADARDRTVDHLLPRSLGGGNEDTNLLTACMPCNSRRGNRHIAEFVGQETLVRLIRDYPRVSRTIVALMTQLRTRLEIVA